MFIILYINETMHVFHFSQLLYAYTVNFTCWHGACKLKLFITYCRWHQTSLSTSEPCSHS